jgi:hypothetical protein
MHNGLERSDLTEIILNDRTPLELHFDLLLLSTINITIITIFVNLRDAQPAACDSRVCPSIPKIRVNAFVPLKIMANLPPPPKKNHYEKCLSNSHCNFSVHLTRHVATTCNYHESKIV